MKIKTSVTERVMTADNPFGIGKGSREKYYEVVVRAYTTGRDGESVTMSFPREVLKYGKSHPDVVAAIAKCEKMTTESLQKHIDERSGKLGKAKSPLTTEEQKAIIVETETKTENKKA